MGRKPRDRNADAASLTAAADRLLAGTPLRSASGKLTITDLITESGLRRDVAYEHPVVIDSFKARVKAQNTTPLAMLELAEENTALREKNDRLTKELGTERDNTAALRRVTAELALELDQAKEQLAAAAAVTRLDTRPRRK
ncbi:hypothetical protein JOF29_000113 [Kribbella aluminosa]|uniref:Uncharacterized protein n=1 Tax=Kribbella aluminosa TaxID=416017 RepID=A0ABS4UBL1_9ACTN|nr:hypothetical protein [Kribbella aluminosa]MBP2349030.1 hypothetical protein [Kribbella aluminosa]